MWRAAVEGGARGARAARRRATRRSAVLCAGLAATALSAWPSTVPALNHAVTSPVRRVLVVGATHGNELTGAWVVQRLQRHPHLARRPSIESVQAIIGNPKAYRLNRRFVDADLNRQFAIDDLADLGREAYEQQRAQALNARYGPKAGPRSSSAADFVVDLHTTTTNLGISYIVERWSPLGLVAAAWCQEQLRPRCKAGDLPPVNIIQDSTDRDACRHLLSVGKDGLTVEIGPVPQGVLRHDVCTWMEAATTAVMDFLEAFNRGTAAIPSRAVVFRDVDLKVPGPVGPDGKPTAVFHPGFQGRDFQALRKGDPIFVDLDGSVIEYDGAHGEVWPVFVNEGAYYLPESGLGFGVTYREEMDMPIIRVDTS